MHENAFFLLLVQIAALLAAARIGAELCRRVGLPSVVGELGAGIAIGPSGFGHFFPRAFAAIFPVEAAQFKLLESVGALGMVLLLLLTGLETDLRLLRNLGRAAFIASLTGMVVPFAFGFGLGIYLPDAYLAEPGRRVLFSFFLATAMAISAMPVIAKILMDLELTKRNIGVVILSAGVVDDTVGWIVLSVIAGAASHGQVRIGQILLTLLLLVAFLAAAALAIYPLARRFMGLVARHARTPDTDLTALLLVTLLCAAATEWMGVHAVFGAFVAGALFRQIPELAPATVHRLESFVFAVLAPIFFGTVGLKVDLWALTDLGALLLVLGIACAGKLVGCTLGSLWGGLRFWEGLSIAVAMNARGAMELIVATVGLSLGILNREMFSIIVVVAVVTSFMAPVGLRLTMRKVRMTEEEEQRIHGASGRTFFDPARVRILLATRGGQNAAGALALATGLAARSAHKVDVLSLEAPRSLPQRILQLFRPGAADEAEEQARAALEDRLRGAAVATVARKRADVANAIVEQARRGYDLVLLGASNRGQIGGAVLEEVVRRAPCHVAAIRAAGGEPQFRRLLVPFDGGLFSRLALEFASQLAELSDATLTVAVIRDPHAAGALADASSAGTAERDLSQLTPLFGPSARRPQVIEVAYDPEATVLVAEASSGKYDLVVLGAEHRALQHRLFFGIDKERLLQEAPIGVAVLVPHLPSLRQEG